MHTTTSERNTFGRAIFLAFATLSAGAALAQSPIALRDSVEQAILQNPEVKLRFHNLEAARHERSAAEGAWRPRVDFETATGAYERSSPLLAGALGYSGSRATLQLRQTLFDGSATRNDVRRLGYSEQAAFYELLSASDQLGLEAARAHLDVLRYRQLLGLAADNFTTHQEVHDRLSQKVSAGVGRRVDLEQASGRMALAESNWLTEVSNLHDVSARYQRLIGIAPAAALSEPTPLKGYMPAGVDYLNAAVRNNAEFLGAVATIRAYRADAEARRAAHLPTLELRARHSYETNASGVTGDYRDAAVELVLNYNLYRGGSDTARVKQYLAKLDSATDLRDKACRDTWQTGQIAFNDTVRLASQLKLLAQHELSTSKAQQAYQQQFDIGQRSLLDLLDTENELYQARRALTNAEYDLQLAQLRVLSNSGSLLEALNLRRLPADLPVIDGGADVQDELLQCSRPSLPTPTLNRSFDSRPVTVGDINPALAATPAAAGAIAAPPPESTCTQLPQAVDTWAGAWNRKDIKTYLSFYAESFVPALGMNRNKWEALRSTRIAKQGDIQVGVSKLQVLRCDGKTAELGFSQTYGSVDYSDQVEKTLSLAQDKGAWKIIRETVVKGRIY